MNSKKLRTRMAPSPTGRFNIGGAFATLMVWLMARRYNGDFILRFEDTDKERSKREFEDDNINGMKWLSIVPDEIYRQSDRVEIHQKYLKKLLDEGKAFYCYHSKVELEAEQKFQQEQKLAPRHICYHKKNPAVAKATAGKIENGIIRLAVDETSDRLITFNDTILGEISFKQNLMGDFSIARSLESSLYNFANVVDDAEMGITHIIRGNDGVSNTPRQILIHEAIGSGSITYAHYPMMLGENKKKLSKRDGALPIFDYRDMGYLPEAIVNFLAQMAFTSGGNEEVHSIDELIQNFEVKKVHHSAKVLDTKKLDWFNEQYVRRLKDQDLVNRLKPFIQKLGVSGKGLENEYIFATLPLLKERMHKFSDVSEFIYLWFSQEYDVDLLKWRKKELVDVAPVLKQIRALIEISEFDNKEKLREQLDELGIRLEDRGLVYWPFRSAITGVKQSPDPVDVAFVLGKNEVINRIDKALNKLDNI